MSSNAVVIDETAVSRGELSNSQYGTARNAEELIRGHLASISPEVRRAMRLPENEAAKAKAATSADFLDSINLPDGGELIDWTIRGDLPRNQVVSYVYEAPDGRWYRGVQAFDASAYKAPDVPEAEQQVAAIAQHDLTVAQAAAKLAQEHDQKVADFRAEITQEFGQKFEDLKEALLQGLADVQEEQAAKAAAAASSGSGSGNGGSWPRSHDEIDTIAREADVTLPDDWGAKGSETEKTDQKIAWLKGQGVSPPGDGS